MKHALITGCSSGFGLALAQRLLTEGWRVTATAPEEGGWTQQLAQVGGALSVEILDVRPGAPLPDRLVASGEPLDLLVNNAGYAVFGSVEETPLRAVEDLFAVNVFGLIRVTQALLPRVRASGGTVVLLSSVAGQVVFPESGFYAATKFAVEALGEALAQEAAPFGVRVRLIEPGAFNTGFAAAAAAASPPPTSDSPYQPYRAQWEDHKRSQLVPPQDPARVVEAILESLKDPATFRRVAVGDDATRLLRERHAVGPEAYAQAQVARLGGGPPSPPTGPRFLHAMVRVFDLEQALRFFVQGLGLTELRRREYPEGRFTLVFLSTGQPGDAAEVELTYNWDQPEPYGSGRAFGHLAYAVPNVYAACQRLEDCGYPVLRPPRDGRMAFVRSPDGVSVELLQAGPALPPEEPWRSRPNVGSW